MAPNKRFVSLPREKLLDAVIENMTELLTIRNTEVASLVSLVESLQWEIDEITVPWLSAEKKLSDFSLNMRF